MPRNKKEGIIFGVTMCFLMVTGMVTFMSVFGLLMRPELPENIVSAYFTAWGMNFIAALPLQLLLVGPISRLKLQMRQRYFDNK